MFLMSCRFSVMAAVLSSEQLVFSHVSGCVAECQALICFRAALQLITAWHDLIHLISASCTTPWDRA